MSFDHDKLIDGIALSDDEPTPCICRYKPSAAVVFVFDALIFVMLSTVLLLVATSAVRGDQEVTVKPGRLKKIETTLSSKKFVWKSVGDYDCVPDSSGKSAIVLFPLPGEFTLLVIGAKADEPLLETITIKVEGDAPKPPPGPGPEPKPDPVNPPPIPGDGLRVLMVYETSKTNEPGHLPLFSKTIRDYLDAKCVAAGYRIFDKDIDASRDNKIWQDAIKRPRTQIPWIVISNGKTGFEGPLPQTVPETLELLKKFGG